MGSTIPRTDFGGAVLTALIEAAAQYYLSHEIDPDDTEEGSKVEDAQWSWAAIIEQSKKTPGMILDVFELGRELETTYGQLGELEGEGNSLGELLLDALMVLPKDSPVILDVIKAIEATGVNYAEHLAARLKKYNLTSV